MSLFYHLVESIVLVYIPQNDTENKGELKNGGIIDERKHSKSEQSGK